MEEYTPLLALGLTSFVRTYVRFCFCVSVRWVTLWVRPPPVKICVSVRWVTSWVRPPPCENMCVRSLGYIVGASPPLWKCVSVRWVTLWVRPPLCNIWIQYWTGYSTQYWTQYWNPILIAPCRINIFPCTPKNFLPPQNLHAAAVYFALRYFLTTY